MACTRIGVPGIKFSEHRLSFVAVPILKKGEVIGLFSIYRGEPGGFAENQIALVTTFADQAVIAIENARLLGELRQRTADLARSVDELTATGDVLKIISRSSVDLETVLDTLVETVMRLCRADLSTMFCRRDDKYYMIASHGLSAEAKDFFRTAPSKIPAARCASGAHGPMAGSSKRAAIRFPVAASC